MPPEAKHRGRTQTDGGTAPVTKRIISIEVSRRLRLFLANRLIALGWGLKGSCKPCAHRLFTTARWLVPEAQRFLIQRTVSQNRTRWTFEFAVVLRTLLRGTPPRVVAGLLIVLALLGSLDLATRTRAIDTQPLVELEPQIQLESKIVSVSKSLEPIQEFVSETASLPRAQIAPVPLPLRKPQVVPNGKGATGVRDTQKKMAQQKAARQKQMR